MKRLKVVCPHCGFYWHSLNTIEELKGVQRTCDYCAVDYEISPNIVKERLNEKR